EATNDYWNRMAILFTSGQNDGQMRRIKDYDGAAKEITLQTPLSFAPANADTFIICTVRAFVTPDIADIADAVLDELTADHAIAGSLSKAISDTLADSNELQTNQGNWATATGFSTHNAAAVKTAIEAAGSSIAQILADSNELQTDWVNGGRLDLLIDAIKVVTDALTSAAATKLALSAGTIVAGTVSHDNIAASTTVFYCDDITEATADHFNGRIVIFTSGALQYQATDISDYALVAGEGKFTVTALTEAPADNVTFIIV
ncbi:hypothetical protein KA005_14435, partial [bacterium]|nr:hypothetical protein [bacterium]